MSGSLGRGSTFVSRCIYEEEDGFFGTGEGTARGFPAAGPCFASVAEIIRGELLVPLYLRPGARKTASMTLPLSSTTRSFIPHFFSQPFRYSMNVCPS